MSEYRLTDADRAAFDRDGYVLKRGWFSAAEVARMNAALANDASIAANVAHVSDSGGASTELALWNHPGDDIFGRVARSERVAGGIAALLGGPVYHYHSKLTMKRPKLGGAWDWHQDYGYWYNNGCLFPDMGSPCLSRSTSCRRVNGCLEVLRGSHHMGRIDHGRVGGQTGADADRVKAAMTVLDHVYCEMDPGDALFFHSEYFARERPQQLGPAAQRAALLLQPGFEQPDPRAPPPASDAARHPARHGESWPPTCRTGSAFASTTLARTPPGT